MPSLYFPFGSVASAGSCQCVAAPAPAQRGRPEERWASARFKASSAEPLSLPTTPKSPAHTAPLRPHSRLGLGTGKAGGSCLLRLQKPGFPASGSTLAFCSVQCASTYLFQCMHGRRGLYLIYSGKSQAFPRTCNAWKCRWLRCREESVQTGLARDALTCSLCPLGPTCASFLEDCSLHGRDGGQGPGRQLHGMARWLREGGGNGAGRGQAALQQMGGRLKHPRSFGCLLSAHSVAEAKNLHPPMRGDSHYSASLPNFSLGFS